MTKQKAFAKALKLHIEIEENEGDKFDVTMWAPEGKIFSGSGCSCFALSWYKSGPKSEFWKELINEMELDEEQ